MTNLIGCCRIQGFEQTTQNLQPAYKDSIVKVPYEVHRICIKVTLRSSVYLARPLLTVHARLTCGLRPGLSRENGLAFFHSCRIVSSVTDAQKGSDEGQAI